MDNVGIVVEDLFAAVEFFRELGLELEGRMDIEGEWAGRSDTSRPKEPADAQREEDYEEERAYDRARSIPRPHRAHASGSHQHVCPVGY
jgi:catechol 2,3-dioxygenase-like lactoylglutathione lyase family enzyme